MGQKSLSFDRQLLELIFTAKPIAQLADDAASAPSTRLWIGLHTADPGDAGTQGTNEVSYAGYTRMSVDRSTNGFILTTDVSQVFVVLASGITFPKVDSTSTGTLTHASIGLSQSSSNGGILYSGDLLTAIDFSQGVAAVLTTDSFAIEQ